MIDTCKVILLSEINSKLGSPFLRILSSHPMIDLVGVVTSPPGALCSYFINDQTVVDLELEAARFNVPVFRPEGVNQPEFIALLSDLRPDYLIVANFQQRIGKDLLSVPRIKALNFHPSPLPRYAGLAPFYWMVRNGERESAVSVIEMNEGFDTGPIIMQRGLNIANTDTGLSLRTHQERQNVLLLLDLIPHLVSKTIPAVSQDLSQRSYYGRPQEAHYLIDFNMDARSVQNQIRAAYRDPGAHHSLPDGTKLTILSTALTTSQWAVCPGRFAQTEAGLFVSASDQWLQILTVEFDGEEVPATPANLKSASLDFDQCSAVSDDIAGFCPPGTPRTPVQIGAL